MLTETTARLDPASDSLDEGDYHAFCDALATTARGRAFLAEYTRRNRNADTEQLLAAIGRLQSLTTAPAAPQTSEALKHDLRALLDEIVTAQCELEAQILATKTAKLAEMIALVERRISAMLQAPCGGAAGTPPGVHHHEPTEEPERNHLAVVPLPEQPELPIPSPVATQSPSIALVRSDTALVRSDTKIAEVTFVETPIPSAQPMNNTSGTTGAGVSEVRPSPALPAPRQGPLASIMSLSEAERLALFT